MNYEPEVEEHELFLIEHLPLSEVLAFVVARDEVRRIAADLPLKPAAVCVPVGGALETMPCPCEVSPGYSKERPRSGVLELVFADSREVLAC